ncbi:hypothetical protein M1112_02790 [Candidatus Parvarchaeota archaeon]|nr:hypothetical protein [Candidatus Parvarchaeota archaeon]
MEETLDGARLHTAEHMFARALQEQNLTIHVRKADTYRADNVGKVYIKEIISIDSLFSAEKAVNSKILEDLTVKEEKFDNLEKAVLKNPKLRFNEERIDENGEIRIISIGEYDFSACKHLHVKKTSEIISFSIRRVSYLGGETEIDFLAGYDSIKFLLDIKNSVLTAAIENHFIPEEIGAYIKNEKYGRMEAEKEEKDLLSELIQKSSGIIEIKGVKISKFYGEVNSIVRKNPEKCIALTNGQQIMIIKGKDCRIDLLGIGKKLKEKGFSGSVNESIINGRADENIIKELKGLWKN